MLEKRKFKRVSLNVRLFYKVQRPPEVSLRVGDKEITTQTLDLSQGGMGFITGYELPPATELTVNFSLIFKKHSLLNVKAFGRVMNCRSISQSKENPSYRVGVEFTNLTAFDGWKLSDFIKEKQT